MKNLCSEDLQIIADLTIEFLKASPVKIELKDIARGRLRRKMLGDYKASIPTGILRKTDAYKPGISTASSASGGSTMETGWL